MPLEQLRSLKVALRPDAVFAFIALSATTLALSFASGGYSLADRNRVGLVIWWTLALGIALKLLPMRRPTRSQGVVLGAAFALSALAAISATWSLSAENAIVEADRVLTYAGVFALAAAITTTGTRDWMIAALVVAGVVVLGAAVLSRLQPEIFPSPSFAMTLPAAVRRLSYPFGYWNALAGFAALTLPLLLAVAASTRHIAMRAAATGAVPLASLALYLTYSRGGAVAAGVALLALIALHPRRAQLLAPLAIGAAAALLLILAVRGNRALADGLTTADARSQGDTITLLLALVVAGGGAVQVAAAKFLRAPGFLTRPRPGLSRTQTIAAWSVAVVVLIAGLVAVGAPDRIERDWQAFKSPETLADPAQIEQRFLSVNGNGRYQHWSAGLHAFTSAPVAGQGAGSFEFWWARTGDVAIFVRDGHSLFFELLGELGSIGMSILLVVLLTPAAVGLARRRRAGPEQRGVLAALLAVWSGFIVHAGTDWLWEVAAYGSVFFIAAALLLAPVWGEDSHAEVDADRPPDASTSRLRLLADRLQLAAARVIRPLQPRRRVPQAATRSAAVVVCLLAMAALAAPLLGAKNLADSQAAARKGDLVTARRAAARIDRWQPWAAGGPSQLALVEEQAGRRVQALAAIKVAIEREPDNWRHWYIQGRVALLAGQTALAQRSLDQARKLYPKAPIFQ